MTTLNLQVSASADDTYENESGVSHTMATMNLNWGNRYGAHRFAATIPQGATISSAALQVYVSSTSYDEPKTIVYGIDADTVSAFNGTSYEVSSKTPTTETVSWYATTGVGTGYKSIDVTDIVQEIVDRDGWSSGNYLCLVVKGLPVVSQGLFLDNYDSNSHPAKLDITYTAPTGVAKRICRVHLTSRIGGILT